MGILNDLYNSTRIRNKPTGTVKIKTEPVNTKDSVAPSMVEDMKEVVKAELTDVPSLQMTTVSKE